MSRNGVYRVDNDKVLWLLTTVAAGARVQTIPLRPDHRAVTSWIKSLQYDGREGYIYPNSRRSKLTTITSSVIPVVLPKAKVHDPVTSCLPSLPDRRHVPPFCHQDLSQKCQHQGGRHKPHGKDKREKSKVNTTVRHKTGPIQSAYTDPGHSAWAWCRHEENLPLPPSSDSCTAPLKKKVRD